MKKIRVSILGATGYTGLELYRRLKRRDDVEIADLPSTSSPGKAYAEVAGSLLGLGEETLSTWDPVRTASMSDVVFTALPHGETFAVAREVKKRGGKLIDIGADYRLDLEGYRKWYGLEHGAPEFIQEAVYCIPELHRQKIKEDTWLVANPGCYPTSIQLALAPFLEAGVLERDSIIADSKSGVSGAGRGLKLATLYGEQNENVNAYGVGSHRHKPEMERHLEPFGNGPVKILFTPHLMPMTRGIHSTIYCRLKKDLREAELREILASRYAGEPFVQVLPPGILPHTKWVQGSNVAQLNLVLDQDTGHLILLSAIDNLVKGASGQAIQNMNLLFGLREGEGIDNLPLFP